MTELYHQLGFRYQWNIKSLLNEGTGDGIIIGPRYMPFETVTSLPLKIRQNAIFDPQFYLPNSDRGELSTYPFFPHVIANGFTTSEWDNGVATECAHLCIRFQLENNFRYIMIPTRFKEGMPADFIENQSTQFIEPFLNALREYGDSSNNCILQLVLTDQMLKDFLYSRDLLNWITSINQIDGIYLIISSPRTTKQIMDIELLLSTMQFIHTIKQAGMKVILGYLNTEAIPLLSVEPDIISMGSYENLRMFRTTAFEEEQDNNVRRGPTPRIYIPRLLQWIEHQYIGSINRAVGNIDNYINDTTHRIAMFKPTYQWHFQKPEPYLHYFGSFSEQVRRLSHNEGDSILGAVIDECRQAMDEFDILEKKGLVLDINSSGRHISYWLTTLNQFK